MKTVTILGARPQFIKAATVSRVVADTDGITDLIVHTGQHHDDNMSDIFFAEMGIPAPAYHLGITGGTHGQMTGRQLEAVEQVLLSEAPDAVIVYGDTNSTLAGALAAAKLNIPIAHVEAGLRSFNRRMPEEINRVMTDHISSWLFAPTGEAVRHLAAEGVTPENVVNVGDVMFDAARVFGAEAAQRSDIVQRLGLNDGGFRLATVHRQENTDDKVRLHAIFAALRELAKDAPLVLPLHPRTRKALEQSGDFAAQVEGLTILPPVGFFDVIMLLRGAKQMITDSGGMQKEAYFHGTPCIVLRDETEWVELVQLGWARLAPPVTAETILSTASGFDACDADATATPYGDGHAADKIVTALLGK